MTNGHDSDDEEDQDEGSVDNTFPDISPWKNESTDPADEPAPRCQLYVSDRLEHSGVSLFPTGIAQELDSSFPFLFFFFLSSLNSLTHTTLRTSFHSMHGLEEAFAHYYLRSREAERRRRREGGRGKRREDGGEEEGGGEYISYTRRQVR